MVTTFQEYQERLKRPEFSEFQKYSIPYALASLYCINKRYNYYIFLFRELNKSEWTEWFHYETSEQDRRSPTKGIFSS